MTESSLPRWCGLTPKSFWRRALLARIRAPQLDAEVHASLAGLNAYLQTASRIAR